MMTKSKKEIRNKLLKSLQEWHKELGIDNFPKRFGISTNEKKFREISFRIKNSIDEDGATVNDVVVSKQPIYGMNNSVVGYAVTYRVWLPQKDGKSPGYTTVRFSLHPSIVAIVKVNDLFITVEHDYFPLQQKSIGLARMFGVNKSENLESLADIILAKEYPFLLENIKDKDVAQLGNVMFTDPSSRYEKTLTIMIDLTLNKEVKNKEELAQFLDHRNKEMLLHHIYNVNELKMIVKERTSAIKSSEIFHNKDKAFIDQYSMLGLLLYFSNY